MTISKYFIIPIVLLSMTISSCLNGVQERNNENNRIADSLARIDSLLLHGEIFSRLVYPERLKKENESDLKMKDTGNVVSFITLGLYKKTLSEINEKYGNPINMTEYTLSYGKDINGILNGQPSDFDTLFSSIPKIDAVLADWEIDESHILRLYLLKERDTFKVFYGYKLNWHQVMVE